MKIIANYILGKTTKRINMEHEISLFYRAKSILANQTERIENEIEISKKELSIYDRNKENGIDTPPEVDKLINDRIKRAYVKDIECFERDLQNVYDLLNTATTPEIKANIHLIYKEIQNRVTKYLIGKQQ